jgi:hypothetical protein
MIKVLKIFGLMTVLMAITSCATTAKLNHAVTGTECETRDECLKALNLSNLESPTVVFIIEPYEFEIPHLGGYGQRIMFTEMRTGDASLCIAKALKEKFDNAAIYFDDKKYRGGSPVIRIKTISIKEGENFKYSSYCDLKTTVTINGENSEINGFGSIGILRVRDSGKVYYMACQHVAQQIYEMLSEKENMKNRYKWKAED